MKRLAAYAAALRAIDACIVARFTPAAATPSEPVPTVSAALQFRLDADERRRFIAEREHERKTALWAHLERVHADIAVGVRQLDHERRAAIEAMGEGN